MFTPSHADSMHLDKYKATFTCFNKLVAISVACRTRILRVAAKNGACAAVRRPAQADMWPIYDGRQLGEVPPSAEGFYGQYQCFSFFNTSWLFRTNNWASK